MKNFHDKVAAITGAGSGIGRQLAIQLAQRGCHLALSDVDVAGLDETARQAAGVAKVRITTCRLDVADRAAVFDWAEQVVADHGRVNLIFNNAGVALSATVERMRLQDFEWLMNINFWGVVHGTQAFLPYLKTAGEGHIVNTSSLFGLLTVPTQSAYHAAKFAVRGFTESLRQELDMLACGVSATCVHPGGIKTAIARNARTDDSIAELGLNPATAARKFERNFITSAERAAAIILKGVRRNARRVLIGPDAVILDKLQRLLPETSSRLLAYTLGRQTRSRPSVQTE